MKFPNILAALLLVASAEAFTAIIRPSFATTTALQSSSTTEPWEYHDQILQEARQIAFNPAATPEQASQFLSEVLSLQTDCSKGDIPAEESAICDNIEEMVEIVAHLRSKIESVQAKQQKQSTLVVAACFVAGSIVSALLANHHHYDDGMVVPFTLQEWFWSLRDGYITTMVTQYLKYGGLVVGTSMDLAVQPFTTEEWMWATRDGYLPTMMADWVRNGGL